jgi:hypothetical protein
MGEEEEVETTLAERVAEEPAAEEAQRAEQLGRELTDEESDVLAAGQIGLINEMGLLNADSFPLLLGIELEEFDVLAARCDEVMTHLGRGRSSVLSNRQKLFCAIFQLRTGHHLNKLAQDLGITYTAVSRIGRNVLHTILPVLVQMIDEEHEHRLDERFRYFPGSCGRTGRHRAADSEA